MVTAILDRAIRGQLYGAGSSRNVAKSARLKIDSSSGVDLIEERAMRMKPGFQAENTASGSASPILHHATSSWCRKSGPP
jgi:hypothetical protein